VRRHAKGYIVAMIVLSSLVGCVLGLYVGQPQTGSWHNAETWGQTVTVWGRVHIEVSPMAYPVQGQAWTIFVYSVDIISNKVSLSRLPNASVEVFVKELGGSRTYNLTADSDGMTQFAYLPDYSDVAFQAFNGTDSSEKVVVSIHYMSSSIVETMLSISSFMCALTGMTGYVTARKKRMKPVLSVLFIGAFVLLALVTVFAFYCIFFLGTDWGYPENVFGGFVTLSLLQYLAMSGIVLFVLFFVIALISGLRPQTSASSNH
jgi:hypothetical protein